MNEVFVKKMSMKSFVRTLSLIALTASAQASELIISGAVPYVSGRSTSQESNFTFLIFEPGKPITAQDGYILPFSTPEYCAMMIDTALYSYSTNPNRPYRYDSVRAFEVPQSDIQLKLAESGLAVDGTGKGRVTLGFRVSNLVLTKPLEQLPSTPASDRAPRVLFVFCRVSVDPSKHETGEETVARALKLLSPSFVQYLE